MTTVLTAEYQGRRVQVVGLHRDTYAVSGSMLDGIWNMPEQWQIEIIDQGERRTVERFELSELTETPA